MADENDIAAGVVAIAAANGGFCSFQRAYKEIPNYVKLDAGNLAASKTRRGEKMWQQIVRNIWCHKDTPGNFINSGRLVHVPRRGYRLP